MRRKHKFRWDEREVEFVFINNWDGEERGFNRGGEMVACRRLPVADSVVNWQEAYILTHSTCCMIGIPVENDDFVFAVV